ncbi:autophagy-related protein 2 homolog B, partial [Diaphorina citri]|uniref:Autophagy-related protein 2 n=1 Tax=Diaphorina citri TaxID=121845 RepID=A0A3Q0JE73_DIACI
MLIFIFTFIASSLSQLRFQHDVYPDGPDIAQSSRQVILIHDVEIRDRLASSNINKFLYAYSSKARPRQSHAHMVVLKALHLRSEHSRDELESCLKVSLLPLRLNIDQDAILFLFTFASELSGIAEDKENLSDTASVSSTESSPASSSGSKKSPIFIKSFVFSPEVLIRLDYQGKHVDMSHGPLAGILMGLAQLNCSEIRLKKINHRHGVKRHRQNSNKKKQRHSQPVDIREGVTNALTLMRETVAETAFDMVSPGPSVKRHRQNSNKKKQRHSQPVDIREGVTNALTLMRETVAETAFDMVSPGPSVKRHRQNSNKKKQRHSQPVDIREGVTNALTLMRE